MVENIWEEWLREQILERNLHFPDYALKIYEAYGMNPKEACGYCARLKKQEAEHKIFYQCGFSAKRWSPDWPACGKFWKSHK